MPAPSSLLKLPIIDKRTRYPVVEGIVNLITNQYGETCLPAQEHQDTGSHTMDRHSTQTALKGSQHHKVTPHHRANGEATQYSYVSMRRQVK